ncbi:MAG: hypothetical protein HY343_12730 [Lentisphaerae bacterium]|nr:hypothetical protein [Lentisphaerota bacterium]
MKILWVGLLAAILAGATGCATFVKRDVKSKVIEEEPVVAPDSAFPGKL